MDYCEYGDLADWNHKISKYQVSKHIKLTFQYFKNVFLQVAKGLAYRISFLKLSSLIEHRSSRYQTSKHSY
jgi:hypothetical protein